MTETQYPKANAFLKEHPNMTIGEAIRYLDEAIKKTELTAD